MKPDFDDHVSGQELEEQIDDAILFTMMTEEENNKRCILHPIPADASPALYLPSGHFFIPSQVFCSPVLWWVHWE